MTKEKIIAALRMYEDEIMEISMKYPEQDGVNSGSYTSISSAKAHIKYMCRQTVQFLEEGRVEKAMRWLGFIQGALWVLGEYSIAELKEHNRPDVLSGE